MIEQDLARIAGALEQIAQAMAGGRWLLSRIAGALEQTSYVMAGERWLLPSEEHEAVAAEEAGIDKPLPTDIDSQAAPTGNADDADHLKRENLKRDLRALGVPFKDSARTGTLQKLLDDKLASMPHLEAMDATEGETPKETEEPGSGAPVTRDDVRMALIELSAAKGKDAALATLRKVGGAEKLSDVAEDRYAAIVKACKERGNG